MNLQSHPLLKYNHINLLLLLAPLGLLGFGYYLQFAKELEPCPMCMTQRFIYMGLVFIAFVSLFNSQSRGYRRTFASLGGILAIVGLGVASRQVWLQHLPADQVPACGPGFNYIVDSFPLLEAIEIMFKGNGNCAEVVWTFLGLSIPEWSLMAFAGFVTPNLFQLARK